MDHSPTQYNYFKLKGKNGRNYELDGGRLCDLVSLTCWAFKGPESTRPRPYSVPGQHGPQHKAVNEAEPSGTLSARFGMFTACRF